MPHSNVLLQLKSIGLTIFTPIGAVPPNLDLFAPINIAHDVSSTLLRKGGWEPCRPVCNRGGWQRLETRPPGMLLTGRLIGRVNLHSFFAGGSYFILSK